MIDPIEHTCRHGRGRESPLGKDIEVLIVGYTRGLPPPNGTGYEIRHRKKSPSVDARALAPNVSFLQAA